MPSQLQQLLAWMESVGITWNRELIALVDSSAGCSGLALGVVALQDVPEGASLCEIPKAACISIRTSPISDILEREELGGGLGLTLAVLHEMSLGNGSEWHGYLQAMPAREYVLVFWSDEELALLEGTEAEGKAQLDRENMAEDFETHVLPLLERYPGRLRKEGVTLENFHVAASYVASRAFGIDDYHGDAMVPLADIFNHKASVVELAPEYAVHGADSSDEEDLEPASDDDEDDDVDEGGSEGGEEAGGGSQQGREEGEGHGEEGACGAGCSHPHHLHHGHGHKSEHSHSHEHRHEQPEGEDAAVPASIMGAGSGGEHSIYGISSANGLHLRLEMAILDKDDHLEIVAASAVPKGHEVHNTYGEKGNADLLSKYGFALRDNPFTAVSLSKQELLAAAAAALGKRALQARRRLLDQDTEVLDEEEEPFEVLPNGHISPALFVALRVLGADDAELKQWSGIGDALSLPAATAAASEAAAGAAANGKSSGGSAEDEGEEEEEEDGSIPAVQIWAVCGEGRSQQPSIQEQQQQQQEQGEQPGAAAEAAEGAEAGAADSPSPSRSKRLVGLLSHAALHMLREAVQARLQRYRSTLEQDRQEWERRQQAAAADGGQQAAPLSEHESALVAALLLRLTEQEVLQEMLAALELREQAMIGVEGEPQQQEEEKAKGKKGGKGKVAAKRQRQQAQAEEQEQQQEQAAASGRGGSKRARGAQTAAQAKGSGEKPAPVRSSGCKRS